MPRRTHPTTRTRARATPATPRPANNSYEGMARELVERGLASPRILDKREPMETRREA